MINRNAVQCLKYSCSYKSVVNHTGKMINRGSSYGLEVSGKCRLHGVVKPNCKEIKPDRQCCRYASSKILEVIFLLKIKHFLQ